MASLLDSKGVLASLRAPPSLSTIGRSYDVAAGSTTRAGANGEGGKYSHAVSTIAQQQNKTSSVTTKSDQWDSVELVEAVIEEADQARRQRQIDRALRSQNRTTLVDRERARSKQRAEAKMASASAATDLEGVSIQTVGKPNNAPNASAAAPSPTKNDAANKNNATNTSSITANKSANSFAQVSANPVTKLMQLNLSAVEANGGGGGGSSPTNANNAATHHGGTAAGRRGVAALSSPRQNPLLAAKVQSEMKAYKLDAFLQVTTKSLPNLDDLVARNLSVATTRRLKREAILERRQRRLLRGTRDAMGGAGAGGGGAGGSEADYDSAEEELLAQQLKEGGGVGSIGVRGAINRQKAAVYGSVENASSLISNNPNASSRPNSPPLRGEGGGGGGAESASGTHSVLSTFRAHSPPATNTLKLPDDLKASIIDAQESHRHTQHSQNHRPLSPPPPPAHGGDGSAAAADVTSRTHSASLLDGRNTSSAMTPHHNKQHSQPVILPPNATFLTIAAKASVKDAISAAEKQDKRLGTSTVIKTSTDKHGNIVKLDGVMLLGNGTTTVTAAGVATAAKMAKVGATEKGSSVDGGSKKGFFGRAASPLQLLHIPDGTAIEETTTYKPGAALATLVENKHKLSRSHFIESRRETSSFNAPPRPALLMPTCAPLHASYHIRYNTVERGCPSPSFSNLDHHAYNVAERNRDVSRKRKKEAEDEAFFASRVLVDGEPMPTFTPMTTHAMLLSNVSAITTAGNNNNQSPARSSSPNQQQQKGGGSDPNSTFFSLTQTKLGGDRSNSPTNNNNKNQNDHPSDDDSNSSGSDSGSRSKRKRRNSELIPTGDRPDVREEAVFRMNNTTVPDHSLLAGPTDRKDFRLHDVRDTSSAFKFKGKRPFPTANLQDVYYYPLPEPGLANYGAGKIVGNARERDWTPFGKPCGAPTTYNLDLIDERQREEDRKRKTPAFEKIVGRAEQKHPFVLASIPSVDTSQFDYKDQHKAVEKRPSCYVSMRKQTSRPPTKVASKTEAPHMNHNSIVSVPKRGFVDLGRMTNYETRDPDYFAIKRANDTTTPLFINPDAVLYTPPAFSFAKGSARFGGGGGDNHNNNTASTALNTTSPLAPQQQQQHPRSQSAMDMPTAHFNTSSASSFARRPHSTEPTDSGYADDSPIRRRAPAAAFPLTDRETRPILRVPAPGDYTKGASAQVFPAKDADYDTTKFVPVHVPSANFGSVVSREQREKSMEQRFNSTDAVYDVPRQDKIKMVMPFAKTTGRK